MRFIKKYSFWMIYTLFVVGVVMTAKDEHWLISNDGYSWGKSVVWLGWLVFWIYTFYCSEKENFLKSLKKLYVFLWARQIGIDLGIGLVFFAGVIWLTSGSLIVAILWLIPLVVFGNLASLVYLAANFDSIMSLLH